MKPVFLNAKTPILSLTLAKLIHRQAQMYTLFVFWKRRHPEPTPAHNPNKHSHKQMGKAELEKQFSYYKVKQWVCVFQNGIR